jgi:hypothetical protein
MATDVYAFGILLFEVSGPILGGGEGPRPGPAAGCGAGPPARRASPALPRPRARHAPHAPCPPPPCPVPALPLQLYTGDMAFRGVPKAMLGYEIAKLYRRPGARAARARRTARTDRAYL